MPPSRRHGLFAFLLLLFACSGDEGAGPRPIPSALEISAGRTQTGVVAQPLDTALTVRVLDQNGEPLAGVLVQFVLPNGAGSLSHLTRTTGPDGQAATQWTLPQTVGAYTTIARVAELDSVSFSAQAGPASAAQLLIVAGDSQWTTVGLALDSAVRVRVVDPFGNVVAGQLVSFVVQSGGGSISTTSAITDSLGQAETRWTLGVMPAVGALRVASLPLLPAVAVAYGFPVQRPDSLSFGNATCHLPASGGLRCWGPGARRPLGTGDTSPAFTPVTIPLAENFVSLHGGDVATCGLTSDGSAWCWGTSVGLYSDVPVSLTPPHRWRNLAIGGSVGNGPYFICGVSLSHQGYCWGQPGPLGNGSSVFLGTPALISGGHEWRDIHAGLDYACGVNTRATVYCWGANRQGQLGNGTTLAAPTPVPIVSSERFSSVSTGFEHACALTLNGRVRCWGRDMFGSTGPSGGGSLPLPVDDALQFTSVRAGGYSTCGLTTTGQVLCWGYGGLGQLGLGPEFRQLNALPSPIAGSNTFTDLEVGQFHNCALDDGGEVWCWGDNVQGAVGVGETNQELVPAAVVGGLTLTGLVAGERHTCGLTAVGEAWCWGERGLGQTNPYAASVSPLKVQGGLSFTALGGTGFSTCGLVADGSAYCWGFGASGWNSLPALVPGGHAYSTIAAGNEHICGITLQGQTLCWGKNGKGQLGDSSFTERTAPVTVAGGHIFTRIVAGNDATCGLDAAGAAFCWGDGRILGDGTSADRAYPAPVSGGLAFQRLAAPRNGVACGITTANEGWCWGQDSGMRFGNGSNGVPQPTPVQVSGGYQFTDISVGGYSTCGTTTTGAALCWGDNSLGSSGTGDTTSSAVPVPVGGNLGVSQVVAGAFFGCALDQAGAAHCWGYNAEGELGTGESEIIPAPRKVQ